VQIVEAGGTSDTTATLTNTGAIEAGTSFDFTIRLTAPDMPEAGQSATVAISSTITSVDGETISGPSETLTATIIGTPNCSDLAGTPVTASLVRGTLPPVPFSLEPQIVLAQWELQVSNPSQCVGWVVNIHATDLVYSGSAPGQADLPAANLRVRQPGAPALELDTTQRLVSQGGPDTFYRFVFDIELVFPGGTPAGTYTSTVTISTTVAP
jgi:hypothetical protein